MLTTEGRTRDQDDPSHPVLRGATVCPKYSRRRRGVPVVDGICL